MANCSITGFDELEKLIRKLEQPEKMAIKAVDAASPVLVNAMKSAISSATGSSGRSKGTLAGSISATSARQNEMGVFSAVRPTGEDEKGVRNGAKLAYLEYGVKSHNQPPRPVRLNAVAMAEGECLKIIQNVIEQEVNSL